MNLQNEKLVLEVKKKREFSQLSDSIIERVLNLSKIKNLSDEESKIKESRATLRKYFGVFLTNRVLKEKKFEKGEFESVLKSHKSSQKRDYLELYKKILSDENSILDLGAGVNGFSYYIIERVLKRKIDYVAFEGVGQLVNKMNAYFTENKLFNAKAIQGDLFDINGIIEILLKQKKPRTVFMFQIIDALEFLERDFSKELILEVSKNCEKIVLSFPLGSLGRQTRFKAKRYWILNFLEQNFLIRDSFILNGERFVVFRKV